jgi:hypothetical protein
VTPSIACIIASPTYNGRSTVHNSFHEQSGLLENCRNRFGIK